MRCNKLMWAASVAVLTVVLLAANAALSSQDASNGQQVAAADTSDIKMPSLFDFDAYKRLFKKSYSGFLENMVRFKYFTSRALRASISAIKYRFRQAKYHLAINFMSDISPGEMDRMRNKMLESKYKSGRASKSDDLPEFIPGDDENVVASLRRLIDDNAGKPGFEALRAQLDRVDTARKQQQQSPSRRRKREVELAKEGPRELPLSNLINVAPENPDAELPAETRAKIRARPKSNNPLYKGFELSTRGLIDQQAKLTGLYLELEEPPQSDQEMLDNVAETLESLNQKYLPKDDATPPVKLPDEVFIDLRTTSNCFFMPRNQGLCGACYIFAATTVAEWLHCRATGELVAFSEQYTIDCGTANMKGLINGCDGGFMSDVNIFFHNFGWELLRDYPYMMSTQQCPYEPDTDLHTTGYIRADLQHFGEYHMSVWLRVLETVGPLAIQIDEGTAFNEYGSGIYDSCEPNKSSHAVVLIGHGREDGEEYWLIRNSHSVGWGEGGYMKLSKKADCIWPKTGLSFGTNDGFTLEIKPTKNQMYDGVAVSKKHYSSI